MDPLTPMVLKRRAQARLLASDPHVKNMESRAHDECIGAYSLEIFSHLVELEQHTRPAPELIHSQPQITVAMRPILFDFLMDVHSRLKLSTASFYLVISIIDRYCSLRIVRKDHFQLLGLSALWLATKFVEPKHKIPSIDFLRATCCHCYSKQLFLEMECHILKSLNWEVDAPTHDSLIDLVLREQGHDGGSQESIKYASNYLCQLMQFHYKCTFNYTVSQISMAAVILATNALTMTNENMFIPLTASSSTIVRLLQLMLTVLKDTPIPTSLNTKFFSKTNDTSVNPQLDSLYLYARESHRYYSSQYPSTPLYTYYNTPMSSRQSSTSSSSTSESDVFSRGSTSTLATPPSSCTASPVNHAKERVPLQQLKIKAPSMRFTGAVAPQSEESGLERKRSLGA
ncbi:G1/S-specific cyclin CLN2 [Cyberlindnera fabianii]|uniref:G1/S-specific cyclin CLN2 n=1 Tax=Cyberlindnera fabianii TaxID=36022 RepID=A0A1V2L7X7_CYBFA|nr:G1/S-specific cyclin CLN2 [Cyberlindnera fabianii]